ncbi:Hypothetical protein R9X50_00048800 [Acrodontium crateriforme]|uniref:Uncharacterized protein n=1 Tax=Acrodontium crateriforme TaxID=150365 RepID=A0AAQ3LXY3_9PEZI|nr:Hypothetical protein R9X50_00048800 [Acrodontium crateriforme]
MDKVKKLFKPGKDEDGSEVMYGTPEPKNIHPSNNTAFPGSSVENQAPSAPEEGMGTSQVPKNEPNAGNPSAQNQGLEAGLGKTQNANSVGDAAPESGLGTQQTQGFDENRDVGAQAGLGREQQEGGSLGDVAPESGLGKRQDEL